MKILITLILLTSLMTSCSNYREGRPVIVKKEQSLWPGQCRYAWEGYGKREYFDDECGKYDIGSPVNIPKD